MRCNSFFFDAKRRSNFAVKREIYQLQVFISLICLCHRHLIWKKDHSPAAKVIAIKLLRKHTSHHTKLGYFWHAPCLSYKKLSFFKPLPPPPQQPSLHPPGQWQISVNLVSVQNKYVILKRRASVTRSSNTYSTTFKTVNVHLDTQFVKG
jgi:hypothetical protein